MANPAARRIAGLLEELRVMLQGMNSRDWMGRQLGIIIEAVKEEVEENPEVFSGVGQAWIIQVAKLMEWTGTGDYSALPPELIPVACKIDGIPVETMYSSTEVAPMVGIGS